MYICLARKTDERLKRTYWLFCLQVRIFCRCIGLFCENVRLFCRCIGLFCGYVRLFCGGIGLFCGHIAAENNNDGAALANYGTM